MPETPAQREDRRRRAAEAALMRFDGLDSRLMRHRHGASGHRSLPLAGGKRSTNGRGKSGVHYYEHGREIPIEVGRASMVAQLERYARDVGLSAAAPWRSSSAATSADLSRRVGFVVPDTTAALLHDVTSGSPAVSPYLKFGATASNICAVQPLSSASKPPTTSATAARLTTRVVPLASIYPSGCCPPWEQHHNVGSNDLRKCLNLRST